MPILKLSKPFLRTMNSEPVNELDVDFSKITTKQYIDSYRDIDSNEIELVAYKKPGFYQMRNLISYAVDCVPNMLDPMPVIPDYKKLERMCLEWLNGIFNIEEKENEVKFETMTVDQYLKIRSKNALMDMDSRIAKASVTTRRDIISCVTGKTIEQIEAMPVEEYIYLDIKCAGFFSEIV